MAIEGRAMLRVLVMYYFFFVFLEGKPPVGRILVD